MKNLLLGQILWLRLPFVNGGNISEDIHPYIIVDLDDLYNLVEIAQLDKIRGKDFKLIYKSNKPIFITDPDEPALKEDCFMQMDRKIRLQYFDGIVKYRKCDIPISKDRLANLIKCYKNYHHNTIISDNKIQYYTKSELEEMNPDISI